MDTRTKIVSAAEAARIARAGATVVSGHFDPMVASHAEHLDALKRDGAPLLILITTPADPILPSLARAQLVAGLAAVDFVCHDPQDLTPHMALETQHQERFASLLHHVHARQRAGS